MIREYSLYLMLIVSYLLSLVWQAGDEISPILGQFLVIFLVSLCMLFFVFLFTEALGLILLFLCDCKADLCTYYM